MARARLAAWTLGKVTVTGDRAKGFVARGYYRDGDNKRREVTITGATAKKAEDALREKVRHLEKEHRGGDATLNESTSIVDAAQIWLKYKETGARAISPKSMEQYRGNVERYVTRKPIATRTLAQVNNISVIESWLQDIADAHGSAAAVAARKVLGGTLALAERRGAVAHNVMPRVHTPRPTAGATGDRKCSVVDCEYDCGKWHNDTDRAFTEVEVRQIFGALDQGDPSDIADLAHFLFGTGARVSEALTCVAWDDLDLDAGVVRIRGTKTKAADRTVTLSAELLERLRARQARYGARGQVFGITRFPSKLGEPRDVRNVLKQFRALFERVGMPWAGTHTFRRTVATWMDAGGTPLPQIADQLGHANVDVTMGYLGRKTVATAAASVMTLSGERPSLKVVN